MPASKCESPPSNLHSPRTQPLYTTELDTFISHAHLFAGTSLWAVPIKCGSIAQEAFRDVSCMCRQLHTEPTYCISDSPVATVRIQNVDMDTK